MSFERAEALAGQGFYEDAADLLTDALEAVGIEDMTVEADGRGGLDLTCPFDGLLIKHLQGLPGIRRDRAAERWRLPENVFASLLAVLERAAMPTCSALGCVIGEDDAPSDAHKFAHESVCLQRWQV